MENTLLSLYPPYGNIIVLLSYIIFLYPPNIYLFMLQILIMQVVNSFVHKSDLNISYRALPFPLEKYTPKQILRMQLTRTWKFRAKAIAKYAPESVSLVQQMLEPDPRKRPTTQTLLENEWFLVAEKGTPLRKSIKVFNFALVSWYIMVYLSWYSWYIILP